MRSFHSIILILTFSLITSVSFSQITTYEKSYVVIYVSDAFSAAASEEIDSFISAKPGVVVSRMDKQTQKYFCVYRHDELSISEIELWITELGYSPKCYVAGVYGDSERMLQLNKEDCE